MFQSIFMSDIEATCLGAGKTMTIDNHNALKKMHRNIRSQGSSRGI